jgi:hypothetical protein
MFMIKKVYILTLLLIIALTQSAQVFADDISSCTTINTPGSYTLTQDIGVGGECITIDASGVNIDGSGYTVTGTINGGGSSDEEGHSFTLTNITVTEDVFSHGGEGNAGAAGSGGTIQITNSTIVGEIYSNGGNGTGSGAGNGGSIMVSSSTFTNIYANGGYDTSGSQVSGNGGDINITSSGTLDISNKILSASWGEDYGGGFGNHGSLILTYVTLLKNNSTTFSELSNLTLNGSNQGAFEGGVYNPLYPGNISSCGVITNSGTYTLTTNVSFGTCFYVRANGVTINGAGYTVTGNIEAGGGSEQDGRNVTFTNINIVGEINASGGSDDNGDGGQNGGNITMSTSTVSSIVSNGSGDNGAGGGSGGNITLSNFGTLNISGTNIQAFGGSDAGNGEGAHGTLSLNYGTLVTNGSTYFYQLSAIVLNGSNQGPFAGGVYNPLYPGNISSCGQIMTFGVYTLTSDISGDGSCLRIKADNVTINGAGYTVQGGIDGNGDTDQGGRTFTVSNIHVTGNVVANAGSDDNEDDYVEGGGSITVTGSSTISSIQVSGGNGGSVTVTGTSTISSIFASGQNLAGDGGSISISGFLTSPISLINANGEGGDSENAGGNGGNVTINSPGILNISGTEINVSPGPSNSGGGDGTPGTLSLSYGTLITTNATNFSALSNLVLNGSSQGSFAGGVYNPLSPGNISSCGVISSPGTYTLTTNISFSGFCFYVRTNGVTINGAGYTATGNISANGESEQNGFDLNLSNINVIGSINTSGGSDDNSDGGHNGGDVSMSSSTIQGSITSNGSEDNGAGGGNAGNVTLNSSSILNISDTNIELNGGADNGNGVGVNGTLSLNYDSLVTSGSTVFSPLSDLIINGISQDSFAGGVYNPFPDTVPPIISNINVTAGTSTAVITWNTDENATSTVNYGLTTGYGTASSSSASVTSHTIRLGLLTPNTTYHYRISSQDALGNLATSSDLTFTTNLLVSLPTLTVQPASSITTTTALLNGSITNDGNASSTVRGFNYGLTTAYGSTTSVSAAIGVSSFSDTVTDLTCNTTYNYRAYATNSAGTGTSSNATFTTSACPVVPTPSSGGGWSSPTSGGGGGGSSSSVSPTIPAVVPTSNTPVLPTGKNIPKDIFTTPTGKPFVFNLNLKQAARSSSDIKKLQILLNSLGFTISQKGAGSPGKETINFGPGTRSALIRFQIANKITPASGFFGPLTRGAVNKLIGEGVK